MIIKMSNKVRSIRGKIEESIDLSSGELKQMIFKKNYGNGFIFIELKFEKMRKYASENCLSAPSQGCSSFRCSNRAC